MKATVMVAATVMEMATDICNHTMVATILTHHHTNMATEVANHQYIHNCYQVVVATVVR
jgi:ABC-type branched-subunit amino acid transport system ATPase component